MKSRHIFYLAAFLAGGLIVAGLFLSQHGRNGISAAGWAILACGVIMFAATMFFRDWYIRTIRNPLTTITQKLTNLSHGDFSGGTIASNDELGGLHQSIGEMIASNKTALDASLQREDRLRELHRNQLVVLDSIIDAVIITDANGLIFRLNTMAEKLTGWQEDHAKGRRLTEVFRVMNTLTKQMERDPFAKAMAIGRFNAKSPNLALESRSGKLIHISYGVSPMHMQNGQFDGVVLIFRDVGEEYRMQASIQRSQKLESLGVMAGGIAHDFNNMLVSIMGNTDLAIMQAQAGTFLHQRISDIREISLRASELTRQLLAYSGKEQTVLEPVNLNMLIEETIRITAASIKKNVSIKTSLGKELPPISADSAQIRQVAMNLIINAAQAIGEKCGCVVIRTSSVNMDASQIIQHGAIDILSPGLYVCLEVSDNGCGMTESTIERIFEPFFTTKQTGRGLGLASSMGIIKSHQGDIKVDSKLGEGSTFTILLPASGTEPAEKHPAKDFEFVPKTSANDDRGVILIIDDEDHVRKVARLMLQHSGYKVIEATCGTEGLDILRKKHRQVRVVLLDMCMPQMSGQETFDRLRQFNQTVPVILISGCVERSTVSPLMEKHQAQFIRKPFLYKELVNGVENIIRPRQTTEFDPATDQN